MKKLTLFLIASILSLSLMACGNTPVEEETPAPSQQSSEEAAEGGNEEAIEAEPASQQLFIADSAMYRGTITAMEETDKGTLVTLKQADGTDFGAATQKFLITQDTQTSFEEEMLVNNAYLEVYYNGGSQEEISSVIAANIYEAAEMVNFNGTLKEVLKNPDRPKEGQLVMTDMTTNEEILFHYDNNGGTQFYLNFEELKPGDQLNIFHKGMFTLSLPPQGIAVEVRPYTAEGESVKPNPQIDSPKASQEPAAAQ